MRTSAGRRLWLAVIAPTAMAAVAMSVSVVPATALDSSTIDRAELDDGELRVEGERAVPNAIVWVRSAESSASSRASSDGRFRVRALSFQARSCRVTVTDGATSAQVTLDECTPVGPPPSTTTTTTTTPPTTTAPPTTTTPPTTTSTTSTTTTTVAPTTTAPPTTLPAGPTVAFTALVDAVPQRCFSAPLSVVTGNSVTIGIESGYNSATWQNKACIASTTAFNPASVSDTFTVTVTAPPGRRITRVRYQQSGNRLLERSTYWRASGTGSLTANGATTAFSFTAPNLSTTVDLAGQNLQSTTVSVAISMSAGRSGNNPRVTNPPGSASISVTNAVISVEFA